MSDKVSEGKHGSRELLDRALSLAARRWHVLPVHHVEGGRCSCGNATCDSAGKHPRTANGFYDATTDAATIRRWWQRWPEANLGIRTGPESGIWMLGPDGEKGIEALAELARKYGGLPRTPTAKSGSGGRHYYFRWPADGNIKNRKNHRGLPIDVRGEGGLAVAPPSRNKNGPYVWEVHPDDCQPAEAPGWLLAWCRADDKKGSSLKAKAGAGISIVDRAAKYLDKMPPAISGKGGHDRTMEAARVVVWGFDLGPEVGYQLLDAHYNRRCQPPWTAKELRHKCSEADTVAFDKPRGWLLRENRTPVPANGQASVGTVGREKAKPPRRIADYQPFPVEALPVVVREYVDASAAAIGCDPALVALPALAVVAGCIGNSRALQVKRRWLAPSVVWSATVGYSGDRKSPAFDAAVDPLMHIQMDLIDEHHQAVAQHNEDMLAWKKEKKEDRGEEPEPPEKAPEYVTGDATIENIGELLRDNPRGLLLARDELDAWFQSFTRYKGKSGGTDRPHWLELHRAGNLRLHRLTRERGPLSVRRACCSVTGTIQPAILARSLDDEALAAGLGARFLMAMPPSRKRRWTEAEVSEELSRRYSDLLRDLLDLTLEDPKKNKPHVLKLDPAAKRIWVDWYDAWGEHMASSEGEQAAGLAKLEGYAVRLALLHQVVSLAAAGVADLRPVGERSIRAGIALVAWFAHEARRVYSVLKESESERNTRRLIEWIAGRGGEVTVRDLQRANSRRWPTSAAAKEELDGLVTLGLGQWHPVAASPSGGHPLVIFRLMDPTHDTTDTCPPDGGASDTRSDTCHFGTGGPAPGNASSVFNLRAYGGATGAGVERVSVVSGASPKNGESQATDPESECRAPPDNEDERAREDSHHDFQE